MKEKTIEQKIWDSDTGVFTECAGKTLYSSLVSPLRIPTFVRRIKSNELGGILKIPRERTHRIISEGDVSFRDGAVLGTYFGAAFALAVGAYIAGYDYNHFINKDYTPAISTFATFVTTNLASGLYEFGRSLRHPRDDETRVS